ncbi:MAG TPA: type II secretion system protein, partial [Methylophaga sp.]|nr:type II secretion system protein [Methylophaga sp.]
MKLDKGFTLIELLAVMLITSILISPYIYQKTVELKEERIRITLSELSDIATSAQNYAAEQSLKWPDEDNQCSSAITLLRNEGYLGSLSDSSIYDTSYSTSCTNSSGKRFFVEVVTQTAAQAEILASHLSSSEANGKSIYFSVPLPSSIPALEHLLPRDGS